VAFFIPYFQHTTIQGVSEKKFTLGVLFSPWLIASWKEADDRIEKNEDGTIRTVHSGDFSSAVKVEVISWSSLLGIVGLVMMEVNRRLRPKITSAPQTTPPAVD
jgi:hypothetical protein